MPVKAIEGRSCLGCEADISGKRGDVNFCSRDCWANKMAEDSRNNIKERFLSKVDRTSDCWIWTASKKKTGYGYFTVRGKTKLAHRVSYELFKGEIPEGAGYHGTCVCHTCDNPSCVNPDHLFLSDSYGNILDKMKKGRHAITRKPKARGMFIEDGPLADRFLLDDEFDF